MSNAIGFVISHWLSLFGGLAFLLTIIGFFFPFFDRFLPSAIQNSWFATQTNNWGYVPASSVKIFVRASEWLSNVIGGLISRPIVNIIMVIVAMFSAGKLMPDYAKADSIIERNLSLELFGVVIHGGTLVAAVLVITALLFIRLKSPAISKAVAIARLISRRAGLENRLEATKRQKESLNDIKGETDEEENEGYYNYLESRIRSYDREEKSIDKAIRRVVDHINEIRGDRDLTKEIMSSTFHIFGTSLIAIIVYVTFMYFNVKTEVSSALSNTEPSMGILTIMYLMPAFFVVIVFLQLFISTASVLSNPDKILTVDTSKPVLDPLQQSTFFLFVFSASLSLLMTYGAFAIGHIMVPDEYIPQTFQMIGSNALFDGLTIAITLILMRQVGKIKKGWAFVAVIILIFLDFAIAAALGVLSIFFGLLDTENAISLNEAVNLLLGHAQNGEGYVFGPLFWVMHTSFLPTTIYLSIMLFFVLAKMVMSLVGLLTKQAANRGLMATGGMLGAIYGLIILFSEFY
ncbi:MAG: hypothetical protein COA85_10550 [Robiginitomaculum sp.]|nr:MAG: hypothetical protein COA85_10550 [Robiginitomaculum sp.]